MTVPFRAGTAAVECLELLPLLPIRPIVPWAPVALSHDTQTESALWNSANASAVVPDSHRGESDTDQLSSADWDVSSGQPTLSLSAAQLRWNWLLQHARVSMLDECVPAAVYWLQRAHAWKNQWEKSSAKFLEFKPDHWVILSACSTAVGDDDAAAAFAVQAWHAAGRGWTADFEHDFRNSRADAATLLALNRMRQGRLDRAAELLECGINGHRVVGDLEQLAADHLLLSMCFAALDDIAAVRNSRQHAVDILTNSLDFTRHHRGPRLNAWLKRNRQSNTWLLKNPRLD